MSAESVLDHTLNLLHTVMETYSVDQLQEYGFHYAKKFEEIIRLNNCLSELDPEQESYTACVQEISEATKAYYLYIGQIPEPIRRLLMYVSKMGTTGNPEMLEELRAILGTIPSAPAPLLSIQSIRPQSYTMQIDAITNQLASLGAENKLKVGMQDNQPVNTTVTLDMPDHMRIEGGHVLSTYDKSIVNGVTSLIESGNTVFSVTMLYHAMTGKKNPTVDEGLHDELAGKLEKMRRMILSIDLSEEMEARYITDEKGARVPIENLTIEGYLLPLNKVSGLVGGKRAELYQILQHPPIYTYSKLRRQLVSVPISLLDAPINNNSTTIPLKTYLLQRIEMMKNKYNKIVSNHILYDSIYKELGVEDANKTKKLRIRTYASTILDYLIEKNYIKSYTEYKKGRSIAGLQIELE